MNVEGLKAGQGLRNDEVAGRRHVGLDALEQEEAAEKEDETAPEPPDETKKLTLNVWALPQSTSCLKSTRKCSIDTAGGVDTEGLTRHTGNTLNVKNVENETRHTRRRH